MPQPNPVAARTFAAGYLFGVPLGELGLFTSVIMGLASGFAAFFLATFLGILFILIANAGAHQTLDYAWSYKRIGLPVGLGVAVVALGYLGMLWIRRQVRRQS